MLTIHLLPVLSVKRKSTEVLVFREKVRQKRKPKESIFHLRCTACYKTTDSLEELELHYLTHELKYDCPECQQRFRCLYHRSLHMSEHYKRNFTCCVCDHFVRNRSSLLMHINTIHLKQYVYHCDECGKGFNKERFKIVHENWHKNDKRHVCIVCKKNFSYSAALRGHQRGVHNVTIRMSENCCSKCNKTFRKKTNLESHIQSVHTGTLCDRCGKNFRNVHVLKLHILTHTGDKPFSCTTCGKCFSRKSFLEGHLRTHTGEKPFACEYCGKCFTDRTPLVTHTRIHTGEKPYICRFCSKSYRCNGSLGSHMRRCTGGKPIKKGKRNIKKIGK